MEFDVVSYLASKGQRGKPVSGGREVAYPCFLDCEEPASSTKRKLYIQTDTGLYHCKVCETSGGSYLLQKHFGDDPRPSPTGEDAFMRQRILDSATDIGVQILSNNDDPMLYLLNERGLSPETIIERKLGFVAGGWSLVGSLPEDVTPTQVKSTGLVHRDGVRAGKDFFFRHLLIPYRSRGHTIQMRGRVWGESKGGKYMTGPGEVVRLFNTDSLDGAEEAIIVEGEFDAMALAQALSLASEERARKLAVVGLAGVGAIPEEFDDLLSGVKRIYLGLDPDEAGKRATEALKERIGARARAVELPYADGRKCDWTEYLLPEKGPGSDWTTRHPYSGHTWRDVLRLLSSAAGKRVFSMAEAGEAYRSYRNTSAGLATGYAGLDGAIQPGLLPGQVAIVLAKTGTGKTLFLCNLAYNMRAQKVLILSLEMTREEVYDRMRRIYLFHHPDHTDRQAEEGLANVYVCDENRLGERDLSSLINEFVVEAEFRPDVVMVDYLGYFARGARGNSPYEKISSAVMQLKAEAKAGRYVIISPSQVNRGAKEGKPLDLDDARDGGTVEETADFLFALFRPDEALAAESFVSNQPPSGKAKLSILKSRHGGKGKVFSFQMDLLTLAIVDDSGPLAKKAAEHCYLAWRGHTWEDLRARETAPVQLVM
jgi:archaellum biogenesis ATPase FlaH/5S rRNA maturation endonuclease (ribonuclease M5)